MEQTKSISKTFGVRPKFFMLKWINRKEKHQPDLPQNEKQKKKNKKKSPLIYITKKHKTQKKKN